MYVYDEANNLAKAIQESKEYKEYKKIKEEIDAVPEMKAKIKDFEKTRYEVQVMSFQGEKQDEEKMKKLQEMYNVLNAEPKIKEKHIKDCLERIGHFKNVPLQKINKAKKLNSYRNKAQIPLGYNKSGNLISGFYSPRSHNIVECSRCLLHPEKFDKIVDLIKFWMKK